MTDKPSQDPVMIDLTSLSKIAIFLEGYKLGKGNIQPMGTYDLEQLWNAIKLLREIEIKKKTL